jgi:hypothetical protein
MLKQEKIQIQHVYNFYVPNDRVIFDRLSTSLIHPTSGRLYNTTHPPKQDGKDDVTGEPLERFHEDSEKSVRKRLHVYKMFSGALVEYYHNKGIVSDIDASGTIQHVYDIIVKDMPEKLQWYNSLLSFMSVGNGLFSKGMPSSLLPGGLYVMKRALSLLTFGIVKL